MPITAAQLEQRKKAIGSSDMAAILGLSQYASAYDIWAQKTGRVESSEGNAATRAGNLTERSVLAFAREELGPIVRNQRRTHKTLHISANIDAIVKASGEPVEAKTSGLTGPLPSDWGEPGTDEIPAPHIIQSHIHMMTTDSGVCHVPALLGGRGYVMYRVHRNEALVDHISRAAEAFWRCVETDTPPEASYPTERVYKAMRREPESWSLEIIPQALIGDWEDAKDKLKKAEKEAEELKSRVLALLGTAEAANISDGRILTFFEQSRSGFDSKRLQAEQPDIWAKYQTATTYRVARIKKGGK
jgi:putative phage-type endonuclease